MNILKVFSHFPVLVPTCGPFYQVHTIHRVAQKCKSRNYTHVRGWGSVTLLSHPVQICLSGLSVPQPLISTHINSPQVNYTVGGGRGAIILNRSSCTLYWPHTRTIKRSQQQHSTEGGLLKVKVCYLQQQPSRGTVGNENECQLSFGGNSLRCGGTK